MKNILVVGAGTMGHGIAQVCAQKGYTVYLSDNKPEALDKALTDIRWSLEKLAKKGLLQDTPENIIKRIIPEKDLNSAAKADYIIETVFETVKVKNEVFRKLESLASPSTIIASNTSVIPITLLAKAIKHPERVVGLHFFTPVATTDIVEVIKGEKTSDDVFKRTVEFSRDLGKTVISVLKDIPGHVVNRILIAATNEALDMVAEGVVSVEDVDLAVNMAYGWPVGMLAGVDLAGVDTHLYGRQTLIDIGETKLVSRSNLADQLVKEGRLGRKVGKGFYRYTKDGKRLPWS